MNSERTGCRESGRRPNKPLRRFLEGVLVLACTAATAYGRTIVFGGESGIGWSSGGEGITPVYITGSQEIESGNTPGGVIDFDTRDGWISPELADESQNIALGLLQRGGAVTAPNVLEHLDTVLPMMIDDNGETAFERKDSPGRQVNTLGVVMQFDLGSQFGVSRFKFFPRNADPVYATEEFPFEDDFLRAFELFLNDGSDETQISGRPVFGPGVLLELQNDKPVVELIIEPQLVRHIQLKSLTTVDFEIAEFQVFGAGFVPRAQYLTNILDFGEDLALWGRIRWEEESIGDSLRSRVEIRTRTGIDDTPVVFNRRRPDGAQVPWADAGEYDGGTEEREIVEMLDAEDLDPRAALRLYGELPLDQRNAIALSEGEYGRLKSGVRGFVRDDVDNWSTWSPPYSQAGVGTALQIVDGEGGAPIVSPGPARYFQVRIDFENDDLYSARRLGSLSIDVSGPSLAEQIVAEISPRDADLGRAREFSYTVIPDLRPGIDLGFSALEISTPVRVVSIGEITYTRPDGSTSAENFGDADLSTLPIRRGDLSVDQVEETRFRIGFPTVESSRIEDGEMTVLNVKFTCPVLRAATAFSGRALPAAADGLPQELSGGNAADIASASGGKVVRNAANIVVQVPIKGPLLINAGATPKVFTPNGDGFNETTVLDYDVTSLIGRAEVTTRIYDLSGRLVREVYTGTDKSGRYARSWDGTDAFGNAVPPGSYLYRISVDADSGNEEKNGIVVVAY